MYHRHISELMEIRENQEVLYIDERTLEEKVGIVLHIEQVEPGVYFAYIASPYAKENINSEGTLKYRDIFVFDDRPNEIEGLLLDPIVGEYGKYIGKE